MKKWQGLAVVFLCLLLLAVAISGCGKKVAATVNGTEIYLEDVDKEVDQILSQHQGEEQTDAMKKQFRQTVLDYQIENELVLQEAKKKKIKATESEIQAQLDQMKKMFSNPTDFDNMLMQQGMNEDEFKERITQDLIVKKTTDPLYKDVKVTDDEAQSYYNNNLTLFQEPGKIQLSQIVLGTKGKAEKIVDKLKKGEDFAELAKKNSIDGLTRDSDGDIGWKTEDDIDKELKEAAFSLEVGEVSDPIKTDAGYVIIKATNEELVKQKTFEEAKDEVEQSLLEQKKTEIYKGWVKKLKKKAKIEKFI